MAFPETVSIAHILSETYFPPVDQAGATLTLSLSLQCEEKYVALTDLENLARMVLDASLPTGYEPVSSGMLIPKPEAVEILDDGTLRWTMQIQRVIQRRLNLYEAALLVVGKSREEATRRLEDRYPVIESPAINMRPSWWPWLPLLPLQVHFQIENP